MHNLKLIFIIITLCVCVNSQFNKLREMEEKKQKVDWNSMTDAELNHYIIEDEYHPQEDEDSDPDEVQFNWMNSVGNSRGDMGWAIIKKKYLGVNDLEQMAKQWEMLCRSSGIDVKTFGIEGNKIMFVAEHDKKDMIRVKEFCSTRDEVEEFDWSGNRKDYIDPYKLQNIPGMGGPPPSQPKKNKKKKSTKKNKKQEL